MRNFNLKRLFLIMKRLTLFLMLAAIAACQGATTLERTLPTTTAMARRMLTNETAIEIKSLLGIGTNITVTNLYYTTNLPVTELTVETNHFDTNGLSLSLRVGGVIPAMNAGALTNYYGSNVVGTVANATAAVNTTNFWGVLSTTNLPVEYVAPEATHATNADLATVATSANNSTNFWGQLSATNLPASFVAPEATHATNANSATFATSASNATNFWGSLNATNLPASFVAPEATHSTNSDLAAVATAAINATNFWGILHSTNLPTAYVAPEAVHATNADNATHAQSANNSTNFWGVLSSTNLPTQYVAPEAAHATNADNATTWSGLSQSNAYHGSFVGNLLGSSNGVFVGYVLTNLIASTGQSTTDWFLYQYGGIGSLVIKSNSWRVGDVYQLKAIIDVTPRFI
jgi:hypothetical protein